MSLREAETPTMNRGSGSAPAHWRCHFVALARFCNPEAAAIQWGDTELSVVVGHGWTVKK
ncbi:hypothetical protein GCM10010446_61260 [Streptomyces enissocaesilis]|uniref:Uncharacterized protein n=1 Tax=Streptomyces enissocaesilis TaxID=332589 RepID=A0ABP6K7D5_9ACTN